MNVQALWLILKLLFVIVFNAVFFVADIEPRNAAVWSSYVFIHISYVFLILTPRFVTKSGSTHVFGMSLLSISGFYFFIELCVGVGFILSRTESWRTAFFVQLIACALYLLVLLPSMIANEHTAAKEIKREAEIGKFKSLVREMDSVMRDENNAARKKALEKTYDMLRSGSVKSHHDAAPIESDIEKSIATIAGLKNDSDDEEFSKQIEMLQKLIDKRNRVLKSLH